MSFLFSNSLPMTSKAPLSSPPLFKFLILLSITQTGSFQVSGRTPRLAAVAAYLGKLSTNSIHPPVRSPRSPRSLKCISSSKIQISHVQVVPMDQKWYVRTELIPVPKTIRNRPCCASFPFPPHSTTESTFSVRISHSLTSKPLSSTFQVLYKTSSRTPPFIYPSYPVNNLQCHLNSSPQE